MGQVELFYMPGGHAPAPDPSWPPLVTSDDGVDGIWWIRRDLDWKAADLIRGAYVEMYGEPDEDRLVLTRQREVLMARHGHWDEWDGDANGNWLLGERDELWEVDDEAFDAQDCAVYVKYEEEW